MERRNVIYVFLIVVILFCGCKKRQATSNWQEPNTYKESLLVMPDSILTNEQRELKEKLRLIMVKGLEVRENKYHFNIDSAVFKRNNVSYNYIDMILFDCDLQNKNIETMIKEVESRGLTFPPLEEAVKKLKEELKTELDKI